MNSLLFTHRLGTRIAFVFVAFALMFCTAAVAQKRVKATPETPVAHELAINESVAPNSSVNVLGAYLGLVDLMGRASGRPVQVVPQPNEALFLEFVATRHPQLLFVKTIDLAGRLIRDHGYVAMAKVDQPYTGSFIVPKGSKFKRLEDLAGQDILMPPKDSFTARMALAMLDSRHIAYNSVRYVTVHEAVLATVGGGVYPNWGVEGGVFQKVGVVHAELAQAWKAKGGRVLEDMPAVPSWCVLVSKEVSEVDRVAMTRAVTTISVTDARRVWGPLQINRMVPATNDEYLQVLALIGG
jgi:ABC-type phosphate/phosphonate transport system substrate-binding protein